MSELSTRLYAEYKRLHKERGLTHEDLADCTGKSKATINSYMRGKSYPDLYTLEAMANRMGVSSHYLLTGKPEEEKDVVEIETVITESPYQYEVLFNNETIAGFTSGCMSQEYRKYVFDLILRAIEAETKQHANDKSFEITVRYKANM